MLSLTSKQSIINLLQEYCDKTQKPLPVYTCFQVGSGRNAKWVTKLNVGETMWESPPFNNKADSKRAAAQLAVEALQVTKNKQGNPDNTR